MALLVATTVAQPRVVVTLHPYADLVARIAGPDVPVVRLLPPGASPHTFDPTPALAAEVANADLVVLNGGLDAWVHELVPMGAGAPAELEVLEALERTEAFALALEDVARLLTAGEDDAEAREVAPAGEEHAHEGVNPHVWLDPILMVVLAPLIAESLAELDPERAAQYRDNAGELQSELRSLHMELERTLAAARGASFVPFHDAWRYFAARYDLDLVVEIEPFPGREPGPRYLAGVVRLIRAAEAPVVFAEAQLGARPAEVIAAEAGVGVAVLDPVGGAEGRISYEDLLRANAGTIAEALGAP